MVGITLGLGAALHAAHLQGWMHRDLNPGWILLDHDGLAKLAGVGISPLLHGSDPEFFATQLRRPVFMRAYLAPEQLDHGVPANHLADVYSLGGITYELLVGNPPGGFAMPPSSRAPVGTHVDQVVFRALHSSREARYQSAAEFGADIQLIYAAHNNRHLLDQPPPESVSRSAARRRKNQRLLAFLGLAAVLLVSGVLASWWYLRSSRASRPAVASQEADDAKSDARLRNLAATLSLTKGAMGKEQKEALMAITKALLHELMAAVQSSRKTEAGMVAAELLMLANLDDLPLEILMKLQADRTPIRSLAPATHGAMRLLTAEDCRIADPGSIDQCLVLASYRLTLRDGSLRRKNGAPHWGQPWVNSMGMRIQPSAARSALLVPVSETLVRDFQIFASHPPVPDHTLQARGNALAAGGKSAFCSFPKIRWWESPGLKPGLSARG